MSAPPYEESDPSSDLSFIQTPPYEPPLDQIPPYSSAISYYGTALLKTEFDTPYAASTCLGMHPVILELNSNQLKIFEFADKSVCSSIEALFTHQNYFENSLKPEPRFPEADYLMDGDAYLDDAPELGKSFMTKIKSKLSNHKTQKKLNELVLRQSEFINNGMLLEPTDDAEVYLKFAQKYRGKLLHSLTLQNLQIGEAPSTSSSTYRGVQPCQNCSSVIKYRNSLRLRVEYRQILLHMWSFYAMVHWYRNLSIGKDLTWSLDTRTVSRIKSIPRHFTAFNNAMLSAVANEALLPLNREPQRTKLVSSHHDDHSFCSSEFCSVMSESRGSVSTAASEVSDKLSDTGHLVSVISGLKIECNEDYYKPSEKQYISNCIPLLNSYDKWTGTKLTILNVEYMLPQNDSHNKSNKDMVFILPVCFEGLVKSYSKQFRNQQIKMTNKCREFFVDNRGLVSIE